MEHPLGKGKKGDFEGIVQKSKIAKEKVKISGYASSTVERNAKEFQMKAYLTI